VITERFVPLAALPALPRTTNRARQAQPVFSMERGEAYHVQITTFVDCAPSDLGRPRGRDCGAGR
jgi:hypothetical protein